ncbi:NUDIX hydrolase [Candidatus Pacearchaeota archaeon]|nr:NUDIX hydrolase [Candidatus Pacearchaeota archaeon]
MKNSLSVTVDIVVFGMRDRELKVLLIKRKLSPFKETWAIPGGFVKPQESLEVAARRELEEETGAKGVYVEQLYTFGDPHRDPRGRVITVAYYALTQADSLSLHAATDASDVCWFPISRMPNLAFDHKKILEYAIKRLRWKFEYTSVAFSLLPEKFTLSQVQDLYEIAFAKQFDKRNFRKKILSLNILNKEEVKTDVSHRPPQLYSLKKRIPDIIEILKPQDI